MKKIIFFILLICAISSAQVKIIFDTDLGGDADDLSALAMLHYFVDQGDCELLAVMCSSNGQYAVPHVDALNRYYKYENLLIGGREDDVFTQDWFYKKPVATHLGYKLTCKDVPGTTELYRRILSKAEDKSITIITVGPMINIKRLLESKPDAISELSGKELISKKVKEFSIMGGHFPEGKKEWNFFADMPGVTKYIVDNIDVPIVFSGFEVGQALQSGDVFNDIPKDHPIYVGFMHFSKNASWKKKDFKGRILFHASFDQTSVLYAIKDGNGKYWDKIDGGKCVVVENGDNKWVAGVKSNHAYLKLKMDASEMVKVLEDMML